MGIDPISMVIGGSALLGGVGSIVGANKASKAADKAADAQSQAAQQQVDLSREIYYDQRGLQQPFYQAGLQGLYGSSGIMNLLGMGTAQAQGPTAGAPQPGTTPNAFAQYASGTYGQAPIGQAAPQSGPNWQAYLDANPDVAQWAVTASRQPHFTKGAGKAADTNRDGNLTPQEMAAYHYQQYGQGEGRQLPQFQPQQASQPSAGGSGVPGTVGVGGGAMQQGGSSQPMVQAGPSTATSAVPSEGPMTQTLRQTPGYQFLLDENTRALENSFASRGKLLSGSAMKALQDRSMGIADQTYGATVDRAFQLANIGQGGAAQITSAGNNYAANAGNAFANMGAASANAAYNKANAFNSGLQGVYNSAMGGLGAYGSYRGWGN